MNACLCKPISHDVLGHSIESFFITNEMEQPVQVVESDVHFLNQKTVDEIKNALGEEKFADILNKFKSEISELIKAVPQLLLDREFDKLAAISHKSVGSSGILGADRLTQTLRTMESAAKVEAQNTISAELVNLSQVWGVTLECLQEINK